MLACTKLEKNDNYKIVELLLRSGALIDYENKDGWTTLHVTAREGSTEIVKLLLHHKADPFKTTKNGRTALHIAALHGRHKMAEVLLSAGLNPNVRDTCGTLPCMKLFWAEVLKCVSCSSMQVLI